MNNPVIFLYVEDNARNDRTVKYSSYMEKFISLQVLITTVEEVAEEVEKVDVTTNETYTEVFYKNVTTESRVPFRNCNNSIDFATSYKSET